MDQDLHPTISRPETVTVATDGGLVPLAAPGPDLAKIERIAGHVRGILEELELDLTDPNLVDTDFRVAKMYLEMFQGLREGAEPRVTTFPNDENYTGMVINRR